MSDSQPNKIFPALYIGSLEAATDLDVLYEYDITHILTVATGIKPKWPRKFKYLTIEVLDMDTENIKQHFQKCFDFIKQGRNGGAVLVHCVAGVSRSAAVCAAYIMQLLRVASEDAVGLVRDARPCVCPNDGFLKQLKAYEREILGPVEAEPPAVEVTQTRSAEQTNDQSQVPETSNAPEKSVPETSDFPSSQSLEDALPRINVPHPNSKLKYCCRMCGTYLFCDVELDPHELGDGQTSFEWRKRGNSGQIECTSYFLQEPSQFGDTTDFEGKLTCPKCNSRFGGWHWAGAQCSCGVWVAPAFQVSKARVDEKKIIA